MIQKKKSPAGGKLTRLKTDKLEDTPQIPHNAGDVNNVMVFNRNEKVGEKFYLIVRLRQRLRFKENERRKNGNRTKK